MSVDFSLKRGYGIIVNDEIVKTIEDKIFEEAEKLGEDPNDVLDTWIDEYCKAIDAWSDCSDYFIGVSYYLDGDSDLVYNMTNLNIDTEEIEKFKIFCNKYDINKYLEAIPPNDYLINFCY